MQPKTACMQPCQHKSPRVCVCLCVCFWEQMLHLNTSVTTLHISVFLLLSTFFPVNSMFDNFTLLTLLKKRTSCSKTAVRCFKRKWVNCRLLGVHYESQTMGLTELRSVSWWYFHTADSVSVCGAHAGCMSSGCPALLLLFSSVCPMWLEHITILLLFWRKQSNMA